MRFGANHEKANIKQDLLSASTRLSALAEMANNWLTQSQEDDVYWLEQTTTRAGLRILMRSAPIDPSAALKKMLFTSGPTVVMTSATIATAEGVSKPTEPSQARSKSSPFDFYQSRIGLQKCKTLQVASPFRYDKQVELIVLKDAPDPSSDKDAFEALLPKMIEHFVGLHDGHSFALFTAFSLLRKTATAITPWATKTSLRFIVKQMDCQDNNC